MQLYCPAIPPAAKQPSVNNSTLCSRSQSSSHTVLASFGILDASLLAAHGLLIVAGEDGRVDGHSKGDEVQKDKGSDGETHVD